MSQYLKHWIDSLTQAEKRFITLLGKAKAGSSSSQQMQLFDWLNTAAAGDELPAGHPLRQNLATVSNRLKELMLDALRLLHKDAGVEARLRAGLDEVALLAEKKLWNDAGKELKRVGKLAADSCRHEFSVQCVQWEQRLLVQQGGAELKEKLQLLRKKETGITVLLTEQQELRYRNEMVCAMAQQFFAARDTSGTDEVREIATHELVRRLAENGGYIEKALAVNILCLADILGRNPAGALPRYSQLLEEWQAHPQWQADQAPLLLQVCRFYIRACFTVPMPMQQLDKHLALLPDFSMLPPDMAQEYQRILYHSRFSLSLNSGQFDVVQALIPQINQWLEQVEKQLPVAQLLPFLHNFAIAEFLAGNTRSAYGYVMRILQLPERTARQDIRDFALVLQVILQYEMGNEELNEYLARAGKRHFRKQAQEISFELVVFRFVEGDMKADSEAARETLLSKLVSDLAELGKQVKGSIPLLGLPEVRMWAQSRREGKPLKEVFLDQVKALLEFLR